MKTFAACENFVMSCRALITQEGKKIDVYSLEKLDLHIATLVVSGFIIIVPSLLAQSWRPYYISSGLIGVISSLFLRTVYEERRDSLRGRR